jgi:hypothetical protein
MEERKLSKYYSKSIAVIVVHRPLFFIQEILGFLGNFLTVVIPKMSYLRDVGK